jgi:hypothetical protein
MTDLNVVNEAMKQSTRSFEYSEETGGNNSRLLNMSSAGT